MNTPEREGETIENTLYHPSEWIIHLLKERKKTDNPREGWEDGTPLPKKERKQTTQGRDGRTVHRHHTGIFKERGVWR